MYTYYYYERFLLPVPVISWQVLHLKAIDVLREGWHYSRPTATAASWAWVDAGKQPYVSTQLAPANPCIPATLKNL